MSILSNPIFHDETKAREWLETAFGQGPICPHCGTVNEATLMRARRPVRASTSAMLAASRSRSRSARCLNAPRSRCNKWLAATILMVASKKGMSALQFGRMIGCHLQVGVVPVPPYPRGLRETKRRTARRRRQDRGSRRDLRRRQGKEQTQEQAQLEEHRRRRQASRHSLVERGGVSARIIPNVSGETLRPILMLRSTANRR